MTWNSLSFPYGSKLTSTQMTQLYNNLQAMADGDAGAPKIQTAGIADDAVTAAKILAGAVGASEIATNAVGQSEIANAGVGQAQLKTSAGSVSTSSTAGANLTLPGGQYGFYPILQSGALGSMSASLASALVSIGAYTDNIFLVTSSAGTAVYAYQRYVTASGERHWLFVLRDDQGRIVGTWEAPDHVCFGNGGKPTLVPHPWRDVYEQDGRYYEAERDPDTGQLTGRALRREIIIINPTLEQVASAIRRQVSPDDQPDQTFIGALLALYDIDELHTPEWDDAPVTVGLPLVDVDGNIINDYRYLSDRQAAVVPVKKTIPRPTIMELAQLAEKPATIIGGERS